MSLTKEVDQAGTSARGAPGVARATMPQTRAPARQDQRCPLTAAPSYEPHGFESLGAILVLVQVDDRSVPQLEMPVNVNVDFGPASRAASGQMQDGHYILTCVDQSFDAD